MKLSTKLIVCFSVVIILIGGIGIAFSYINESVKDQVTTESKQAIEEIEVAGEMGLQLYQSLTRSQYLLEDKYRRSLSSNFESSGMTNEAVVKQINGSLKKFQQSLQEARSLTKKDNPSIYKDTVSAHDVTALLEQLETKFNIYSSLIKQLQQLSSESYADGKEFFTVTIEPYFRTNLLPLIEDVRKEIQVDHEQKIASLNIQLGNVSRVLGIATIFALLVSIALTFFLYRSIANPINKLAEAAQKIAHGNLNDRIDYKSNDELGQLSETFNNMAESLSRTTVSRDYVDSIIESMADLLIVTDQEYNITRINSAGQRMLRTDEEQLLGNKVQSIFEENEDSSLFDSRNNSVEDYHQQNADLLVSQSRKMPVNVSKGTLKSRNNDTEGYVIVASDISSEKKAQERIKQSLKEKEVLLAEIHHRVKNNLAVISGLLQMQIWEAETEQAASALQESQFRVRSIALVHEKLYQSDSLSVIEFDKFINDLLQAVSSTYISEGSNIEINTRLEPVVLNINQAIPCSLLLNELIVNAFKHAFGDQDEGVIAVAISRNKNLVTLKVNDNGQGFPGNKSETKSLGMSLIETLTQQLDGQIQFRNSDGAEIEVTFEIEEV